MSDLPETLFGIPIVKSDRTRPVEDIAFGSTDTYISNFEMPITDGDARLLCALSRMLNEDWASTLLSIAARLQLLADMHDRTKEAE